MTRKDYVKLSRAIRRARSDIQRKSGDVGSLEYSHGLYFALDTVIDEITRELSFDNSGFDGQKFRAATGSSEFG